MAVDHVESALQAVTTHLATLVVPYRGATAPLRARPGWPEKNESFDLEPGPLATLSVNVDPVVDWHSPYTVREGPPPILWKVADVTISAQLDLWASHRAVREDAARVLTDGWHNRMPFTPGLFLTQPDYHLRPLHAMLGPGRNLDDRFTATTAEFRRMWNVVIDASLCIETQTPQQLEIILRLQDPTTMVNEDTTITP